MVTGTFFIYPAKSIWSDGCISKNNFHSGRKTPTSGRAASALCILCALAIRVFFAYHVLRLVHPDGPFSFPMRPARLSRPIPFHHRPPSCYFVSGVRRTLTKLSALGAPLSTPPLRVAWIRLLASQNASFVVSPPLPFYKQAYCSMENSLVVTIH